MKDLKIFDIESDYTLFKYSSSSFTLPNVSYTKDSGNIWVGEDLSYIVCTYYVEDVENEIEIIYDDKFIEFPIFVGMSVDDGEYIDLSNRVSTYIYSNNPILWQFDSIGIHTVKFFMNRLPYPTSFYEIMAFNQYGSSMIGIDFTHLRYSENITSMANMFEGNSNTSKLGYIIFGNEFDTSNVTNMKMTFNKNSNLTFIQIGNKFNTTNVKSFYYCFNNITTNGLLIINNNPLDTYNELVAIISNNQLLLSNLPSTWDVCFRKTLKFRLYDSYDKNYLISDVLNNDSNILPCMESCVIDYDGLSYSIEYKDAYYDNDEGCWIIEDMYNIEDFYIFNKNNTYDSGDYMPIVYLNEEKMLSNGIVDLYLGFGFD